ncbi:MAG TPA: hypothetical protein VM717_12455 [Chthoniobacterales bacterium]|nr:hypothetical protein [Chthoniobacterales bacterium]
MACGAAAIGLAKRTRWGIPLALAILTINLVADLLNAFLRHDLRILVGLPIGGAMVAYLLIALTDRVGATHLNRPRAVR